MSEADLSDTLRVVERFNAAFNRHDVDAIMALMTGDCRFENTWPAPGGTPYVGQAAVRKFWQQFFADAPDARFDWEEVFACGDRAVVRWTYRWSAEGHIRGVDVMRVRNGKVAEKLSYVKG
jgi:ketosteroid isomerase-like protein